MIVLFINVLTYKQMFAIQKAQNKLQQCKNYQISKKTLQGKMVQNKIESNSYLKWTKKCDFYFISIRNSNITTSVSSSLGGTFTLFFNFLHSNNVVLITTYFRV